MRAKYITGESQDAAEELAVKYFECNREDITFEVISGEEGSSWNLLAMVGTRPEIVNQNASFNVFYESDGVYLELYENRGAGSPLDSFALLQHLTRKNISGLMANAVQELINRGFGRMRVAAPQSEYVYGEDVEFQVTNDEMTAFAILLAPEEGGPAISFEMVLNKLRNEGISHGVDQDAVKRMLESKDYGESKTIATGTLPVEGEDGKLIFHFSTDQKTGRPKEIANSGGRVDYRTLDLFEAVTEGQLLVTREAATEGKPGYTVKGNIISQKPGKEAIMPRGKNVDVNPEKTHMFSKCSGMVQFINNAINVSSLYKVNGDCDIGIGNIEFDGSVQVSGAVRSGHTINATGSVVIGGGVEAATIIAGGNVEIKGGMQGGDRGLIEAGGTITALYIERGTAIANDSVFVDVCIKSNIESGGSFVAKGKRGAIIGGRVSVAGDITANYIGALSNVQTEVEVGAMPRKRARLQALEQEQEKLAGEMNKLVQLKAYLSKMAGKLDQEIWDKLFYSGEENRKIYEQNIEENDAELAEIKREIENATDGKVHVLNSVYAGSRIIIGSDTYKVNDDIQFATFRYSEGQITYGPCEKSKGS